jgi:integrase
MDIKTSVFKRSARIKTAKLKDGSSKQYKIKGGWIYRVRYVDPDGRPCTDERGPFERKNDANDAMKAILPEIQKSDGRSRGARLMTFSELADLCEKSIFRQAEFISDQEGNRERIAGIKSWKPVRSQIEHLKRYFGNRLVTSITTDALRDYKVYRRKQFRKTKEGEPERHIQIATVNREFATMRRIMRYAREKGWITRDIFAGSGIIEISKERERTRLLTRDEEVKLLAACEGDWERGYTRTVRGKQQTITAKFTLDNQHLKAMIMLALDSGMRRGEILKLRWKDIDFENNSIRVVGTHTKTEKLRDVMLSDRAKAALEALRPFTKAEGPFPYVDIKRSFGTAKKLAGIKDLRFHDLRRTAITRWQHQGTPLAIASTLAGHSIIQTTAKHYTAADGSAIQEMNDRVNAFNSIVREGQVLESESVN